MMRSMRSRLAGRALPLAATLALGVAAMAHADAPSATSAHDFGHDPIAQTYLVQGEVVPVAAVKRDLSGALCSKCHAGAVSEIKSSVHFTTQGSPAAAATACSTAPAACPAVRRW